MWGLKQLQWEGVQGLCNRKEVPNGVRCLQALLGESSYLEFDLRKNFCHQGKHVAPSPLLGSFLNCQCQTFNVTIAEMEQLMAAEPSAPAGPHEADQCLSKGATVKMSCVRTLRQVLPRQH